jgi:hypothetical protein
VIEWKYCDNLNSGCEYYLFVQRFTSLDDLRLKDTLTGSEPSYRIESPAHAKAGIKRAMTRVRDWPADRCRSGHVDEVVLHLVSFHGLATILPSGLFPEGQPNGSDPSFFASFGVA